MSDIDKLCFVRNICWPSHDYGSRLTCKRCGKPMPAPSDFGMGDPDYEDRMQHARKLREQGEAMRADL